MLDQWHQFTQDHPFWSVLILCVIYLIFAPPRWDPATRIKEWSLKRKSGADKVHIFDARDGEM